MVSNSKIRTSKELRDIINYIRAEAILKGRKPPRTSDITRYLAKKIDKEELKNEIIKF